MRVRHAMTWLFLLVGLLGCPHAFRKDGSIDQAALDDVEEMLEEEPCPPMDQLKKHCAGQPDPAQCIKMCEQK